MGTAGVTDAEPAELPGHGERFVTPHKWQLPATIRDPPAPAAD